MSEKVRKPVFKAKRRPKKLRKRMPSADDNEAVTDPSAIHETRMLQKMRQRRKGVSHEELISKPQEITEEEEQDVQQYGLYDPKAPGAAKKKLTQTGDGVHTLQSTFTVQTDASELDPRMEKFIEEEMRKKRGLDVDEELQAPEKTEAAEDEAHLYSLNEKTAKPEEQDTEIDQDEQGATTIGLSITDVEEMPLPIDLKLFNIERTEKAKRKLAEAKKAKAAAPIDPDREVRDITANFAEGNYGRFSYRPPAAGTMAPEPAFEATLAGDGEPEVVESDEDQDAKEKGEEEPKKKKPRFDRSTMASDDMVYDRFRKRHGRFNRSVVGHYA